MTPSDAAAPTAEPAVDRILPMARALAALGRTERAVDRYDEALAIRPSFEEAFVEVVDLLEAAGDWRGIATRCETWIAHHPDHASHGYSDRVHNLRIGALDRIGGIELAYAAYGLEQVTAGPVGLDDDEIVTFVGARNEAVRLPYLLDHHRRLGVDRFLVVDNGSEDGSLEFLLDQPDTVVWQTTGSFGHANNGAAWADLVLRRHVARQWCLIVDADELFVYPDFEHRGIRDLCAALDREDVTCYPALLLDLYGAGRLSEARYRPGQDPLEVFEYFDRAFYRHRVPFDGPRRNMTNYWGGVRSRVVGGGLGGYLLHKVPLFRYAPGQLMFSGNHWLDRPTAEIATGRGALLHFKFDAGFADRAREEVIRKEHARGASAYQLYERALTERPDPVLFDPMHSVRFDGSAQLVRIGLMRKEPATTRVPVAADTVLIPPVSPVAPSPERPSWSVVVVAGVDETGITERVAAVLGALGPGPASEVVVVLPPGAHEQAAALAGVSERGRHRVVVVASEDHLIEVEAANLGLGRTRGSWVHVVGAVGSAPPDYRAVQASVEDAGVSVAVAWPEPFRHACDLDFAMTAAHVVARRDLYERVGGFCPTLSAAAAWELLQRLEHASQTPPVPLPMSSMGSYPLTARRAAAVIGYGEDVVHWLAAIDLAAELTHAAPDELAGLHDRCARRAAELVRDDVEHGRFASALATVGEALRVPVSDDARQDLLAAVVETVR